MNYYRVGNRVDDLALYAYAATPAAAVKLVEELCGPIPPQQLKVAQVKAEQIPEGENVLGTEGDEGGEA